MARNGSGVYSKVNTFVSGTTITASGHNQNWDDLATEMTNSVAADGQTTMTGPLKAAAGTVAAPSYTFAADTDSGLYRAGANIVGVAAGGLLAASFSITGTVLAGTTLGDNASSGYIGEFISSTVLISAPVSISNNIKADITHIDLSAGDWDVYGSVGVTPISGGPTVTAINGWIHNVSVTEPTDPNEGAKAILYNPVTGSQNNQFAQLAGLRKRVLIASSTTYFLTINAGYSSGSLGGYGFIAARRVR